MPMSNEDYQITQEMLFNVVRLTTALDLPAFLERIETADAIGAVIDPTLYRDAASNLDDLKTLAEAANTLRQKAFAIRERERKDLIARGSRG
jgi:hypothetical protein